MRRLVLLAALLPVACESAPLMRPPAGPLPPLASSSAERPSTPARRLLAAVEATAAEAGAGALGVVASELVAEGDRLGAFVEPPAGACLLAVARGSEGIDDIDLLAFNDDGAPLAVDEAQDPNPALLLCPPHPGRVYLLARVMAGRGLVAVGAQPVALEAALRVGKAVNARGRPGASGRETEAWPGLDAKAAAVRKLVGGQWREARRVALPSEARAPARVTEGLEAGRCLLMLATPSDETSEIDVQLIDGEGRALARANEIGRDRVSVVCASMPAQVSLEVRPRIGAGVTAVVLARSVERTEADISMKIERIDAFADGDAQAALGRLGERLTAAGYGAPQGTRVRGEAKVGRRTTAPLTLPAGCVRLDVVGGAPLAGVVAELWSAQGTVLGRAEGGARAALFACGPGGPARLEVEAQLRPGPFAAELRADGADAALAGLAGGRLLGRLNAPGDPVRASTLQGVRKLALTSQTAPTADYRVPERRCLEIATALGPGGAGVELRLLDATSREELAQGSGAWSTAAQVCAGATPLAIAAEVRLSAGQTDALLGAHAR